MNSNLEREDFQQLRRLLRLKRFEQPPPGYFDRFPCEVLLRLRSPANARQSWIRKVFSCDAPWLQWFLGNLQDKPALAGGFGFAVCGLLLVGLVFAESPNNASEFPDSPFALTVPSAPVPLQANPSVRPVLEPPSALFEPTVEVVAPAQRTDSLFRQLKEIQAPQRALLINSVVPTSPGQ